MTTVLFTPENYSSDELVKLTAQPYDNLSVLFDSGHYDIPALTFNCSNIRIQAVPGAIANLYFSTHSWRFISCIQNNLTNVRIKDLAVHSEVGVPLYFQACHNIEISHVHFLSALTSVYLNDSSLVRIHDCIFSHHRHPDTMTIKIDGASIHNDVHISRCFFLPSGDIHVKACVYISNSQAAFIRECSFLRAQNAIHLVRDNWLENIFLLSNQYDQCLNSCICIESHQQSLEEPPIKRIISTADFFGSTPVCFDLSGLRLDLQEPFLSLSQPSIANCKEVFSRLGFENTCPSSYQISPS
jgi:hypothetical protein